MKILIIENEPLPAQELSNLLIEVRKDCDFFPVLSNIRESVQLLSSESPDLIFMDIELSDGIAFDIFRQVKVNSPVVFTTGHQQYITDAFDNNGIAYLLKPIRREMIESAFMNLEKKREMFSNVNKLLRYGSADTMLNVRSFKSQFLVKHGQKLIPVKTEEINHFICDGGLVCLVTRDNRKYVTDETLSELEMILNPGNFFRMNRKYLISKDAVLSLDNHSKGQVAVKSNLLESEKIIVSRQQTRLLKDWLNH